MSRYELWLQEQAKMIDGGAAVATIVLEDPEQSVAGTWPIGFKDLAQAVEGMLISLRESLPKGRHQYRLVAFDQGKNQLSFLPVVVVGASDAASDASRGRVDQERANALFISNCEKMLSVQATLIDSMSQAQSQLLAAHAKTSGQLDELIELTRDEQNKILKEAAREERMGKLFEQFAPVLQLGLQFAGEYGTRWLAQKMATPSEAAADRPKADSSPQVSTTEKAPAELASAGSQEKGELTSAGSPISSEPPRPCDPRVGEQPAVIRADGQGSIDGISRGGAATVGRQTARNVRKDRKRRTQ